MKCIYCGTDKLSYDNATKMWTCEDCQQMFDDDDIIKTTHISIPILFIISFLCFIPVINLFVMYIISNSTIDDKYKNSFIPTVLSQYFVGFLVVIYLIAWKDSEIKDDCVILFNKVEENLSSLNINTIDDRYEVNYRTDYSEFLPKDFEEIEEVDNLTKDLYLFSDIDMAGSKVLELTETYKDSDVVVLVQTKAMAKKHDKDTYRNFGILICDTTDGSNELIKYFDIKDEIKIFTDDYENLVSLPFDDLTVKKYIFYINPKSKFNFQYSMVDGYSVFIFKELED